MADSVGLTGIAFTVKGTTDASAVQYFKNLASALSSYKEAAKGLPTSSMVKLCNALNLFEGVDTQNLAVLGKAMKDLGSGLRALSKASQEPFNLSEDTINSIQKLVNIANSISCQHFVDSFCDLINSCINACSHVSAWMKN